MSLPTPTSPADTAPTVAPARALLRVLRAIHIDKLQLTPAEILVVCKVAAVQGVGTVEIARRCRRNVSFVRRRLLMLSREGMITLHKTGRPGTDWRMELTDKGQGLIRALNHAAEG